MQILTDTLRYMGVMPDPAEIDYSPSGRNWESWTKTLVADLTTPKGIVTIDARRAHCGHCEHCDRDGYCELFGRELEAEIREEDGHFLDRRRCGECLSAQVSVG